ncbi:MAG: DnaA/Hda family protein, partial [Hyphomicrobiales bacterium]
MSGEMKGKGDAGTGNFEYFDTERHRAAKDMLQNVRMEHTAQDKNEPTPSDNQLVTPQENSDASGKTQKTTTHRTTQANPTKMTSPAPHMPEMPVTTPATPSSFVDDASQEDPQEIWQRISARLRSELGEDVFTSWFLRVELESLSGGVVTLSAATRFLRNWIMSHFKEKLTGFWEDEVGTVHRLDIRVRGALRARAGQNAQAGKSDSHTNNDGKPASARRLADMRDNPSHVGDARGTTYETGTRNTFKQSGNMSSVAAVRSGTPLSLVQSLGSALDRRYVFDSFCSGAANKVAFEAARSVAMALPGAPVLYNPLYLHGSVGLGKTHLLQAIANQAASTGARQVVYLTAERFMANFVQALRSERALQFKEQLRAIDLLLIDDMQFLTGKAIQQEFCHMLNALIDGGKQVVVAADRPASELDALEERVRSRLQGGA